MWVIKVVKFLIVKTQVEANRKSSLYGIFMMKIHIAEIRKVLQRQSVLMDSKDISNREKGP